MIAQLGAAAAFELLAVAAQRIGFRHIADYAWIGARRQHGEVFGLRLLETRERGAHILGRQQIDLRLAHEIGHDTLIDDTFAEAFPMKATRLVITAHTARWARHAAESLTGFATSVIGCGAEAGIERELTASETPDGRPGLAVLLFAVSSKELAKQIERRVGQCVLTCPTTAVYSGIDPATSRSPLPSLTGRRKTLRKHSVL